MILYDPPRARNHSGGTMPYRPPFRKGGGAAQTLSGFASLAIFGVITEVMVERTTLTRTLGAMSTSISDASSFTRATVPTMPPAVTT